MTNSKLITILTTSHDCKSIISLNKKIYQDISIEYKKLYIINLNNLLFFKKEKKNKTISDNKKIIYFEPKSSKEFLKFCGNKKIVAFIGLGKTFNFYRIHFLLNKINICQILLLNLGFLNNSININYQNVSQFWISFIFKFNRYMSKKIFRLLTIINVFPKVDYYFDSSKQTIDHIKKSKLKKIEKRFPCIKLSYFKNANLINSRSFDDSLNSKNMSKTYITYIDTNITHSDRIIREGKVSDEIITQHCISLKRLLINLNKIYNKKIVICLHPTTDNKIFNKIFSSFIMKKHQSLKYIRKSHIILFHESSAALDALLLKKNLISLETKNVGTYVAKRSELYRNQLGLFSINLDNQKQLNKQYIDKEIAKSGKKSKVYISEYLNADGNLPGYKKILQTIKNIQN